MTSRFFTKNTTIRTSNKMRGSLLLELVIVLAITAIVLPRIIAYFSKQNFETILRTTSQEYVDLLYAVQARNNHDSPMFSLWSTNGSNTASTNPITWNTNTINPSLVRLYLTGRKNSHCGNMTNGWNPINSDGSKDGGNETYMESENLVSCDTLIRPRFFLQPSAVIFPDPTLDSVSTFALYIDTSNSTFEGYIGSSQDESSNVIQFYTQLTKVLSAKGFNSLPEIQVGLSNDLDNIGDDTIYTVDQCQNELKNNRRCDIMIYLHYSGNTNGFYKRTDDLNSFTDDVTFKDSLASGKQQCAYWEKNTATNTWVSSIVPCAIKAGVLDPDVKLVVDESQSKGFYITDEVNINHLCQVYEKDATTNKLLAVSGSAGQTPCGMTMNGTIVQLLTDKAFVGEIYGRDLVTDNIYSGNISLYNNTDGSVAISVFDSSHNNIVYSVDNRGNVIVAGNQQIDGELNVNGDITGNSNLTIANDVVFSLNNTANRVAIGDTSSGLAGIEFTRNNSGDFNINSQGNSLNITHGSNDEGLSLATNSSGDVEINLKANGGVITENGTGLHSSFSTLLNQDFDPINGISTDAQKALSRVVTADMAMMLNDKSSPIQIVGTARVDGTFSQIQKPDCTAFMDDSRFSSPQANPYRKIIDEGLISAGESYARLILVGSYFKTYNSAFGDNQIFTFHAVNSTPTTWDVFLYLTGEGASGTGAREDGAGGAIALILCDLSSINLSRQAF
jgi:hypothetical protein